ncbi:DUF5990 family protein [Nocardia alba]|uniref:DUF5990 family protein n=1 Tax=Nocardia alba TaxID=225051 RepID=UPI001FB3B776|nr:DUF5990 family protein [Nocardia alba]
MVVGGTGDQRRPGNRFLYLSWVTVDDAGATTMFRRAELMLADVCAETLAAATESGVLQARVGLTDATGNPLCARVQPATIDWSAAT